MSVAIAAAPAPKPRPTHEWPAAYVAIRERLATPRRAMPNHADVRETLHPHHADPGDEFPFDLREFIADLPRMQKIIAAQTALQIVMPVWDAWDCEDKPVGPENALYAADRAFDRIGRWNHQTFLHAKSAARRAVRAVLAHHDHQPSAPFWVAKSAESLLTLLAPPVGDSQTQTDATFEAIVHAGNAMYEGSPLDDHGEPPGLMPFLRRWWTLLRCRLAFADATTAHLLRD